MILFQREKAMRKNNNFEDKFGEYQVFIAKHRWFMNKMQESCDDYSRFIEKHRSFVRNVGLLLDEYAKFIDIFREFMEEMMSSIEDFDTSDITNPTAIEEWTMLKGKIMSSIKKYDSYLKSMEEDNE